MCFTNWLYRRSNSNIDKICLSILRFYLNFVYCNFKIKNSKEKFSLFGYLHHDYDIGICIYLYSVILIFCNWTSRIL
jgi:hypothetical protein